MLEVIVYFVTGGALTTAVILLEENGAPVLSGIAALMPLITLVAYFFLGTSTNGAAISRHASFVLVGSLVSWVPYMLMLIWFAPSLGAHRAIALGLIVFFVTELIFVLCTQHFGWFS